jgi:hypothetical protein
MNGSPILMYIDVGSGALIIQVIVGSLLGVLLILRSMVFTWTLRIKSLFMRGNPESSPDQSDIEG